MLYLGHMHIMLNKLGQYVERSRKFASTHTMLLFELNCPYVVLTTYYEFIAYRMDLDVSAMNFADLNFPE